VAVLAALGLRALERALPAAALDAAQPLEPSPSATPA